MQHRESGVSEIISAVLAVILVIALAFIIGAIFLGWAVPLQKTAYIATQTTPVNITNASAVQLFLSQGETVSLAPATSSGLPVKFSMTNGSVTYNFVPLPGAAPKGWRPGDSIYLFRNATGTWVADNTASVKNNSGFSAGTWTVNIVDATSKVLIAQHTVTLKGGGAPAPYPVYPGLTAEAWIRWNQNPAPTTDDQRWAMIVVDGDNDANRVFQIGHDQFNTRFEFRIVTASTSYNPWGGMIQSDIQPQAGVWYHVAEVYNQTPGTFNIYVNGIRQVGTGVWSTDSSGMKSSTGTVQTGGPSGIYYNWASNQRKFNGDIRGLKTYDRAMVSDEVASRFASGPPSA